MTAVADGNASAPDWPHGHVGYVALLGRPNAGKSTFLNAVLRLHLAPVSAKPQTTRRRFLGILTDEQGQILFLDAPGIHVPKHALDEVMAKAVDRALADADLILCMADTTRAPGAEEQLVASRAGAGAKPVLVALNKTDIASAAAVARMREFYAECLPEAAAFAVAAMRPPTLKPLLDAMLLALPHGPYLYPEEVVTDSFERDIAVELIREALLENLEQEVPHAMAVTIEAWEDDPKRCRIQALLHVEREPQRRIVIGRDGRMIAQIRTAARRKLAELLQRPVRLRLWVKVAPDWRRNPARLREFNLSEGGRH